jgi:hypothetical protein
VVIIKKNIIKTIINIGIFYMLFAASGCTWFTNARTPFLSGTNFKTPDGTPAFKAGFEDGCSSALYSRGNAFYRARYDYRYDPNMIGNTEYHFGHRRGYGYCFVTFIQKFGSGDAYIEKPPFDMIQKDMGEAWGGFFSNAGGSIMGGNPTGTSYGVGGFFDVLTSGGKGAIGGNPLWAGGSKGQFFGWSHDGYAY